MKGIFDRTKDLDPTVFTMRDGKWIKEKSQEIRSFLHKNCSENCGFWKSGHQDGENILSQWSLYCYRGSHPTWADALILTPDGLYYIDIRKLYKRYLFLITLLFSNEIGRNFLIQYRDNGRSMGEEGLDTGGKFKMLLFPKVIL